MPDVYTDGMPVSPFGRMQGLFDDEFGDSRVTDGATLLLADLLNSGKPSDIRKVLTSYNNEASSSANGQIDMFSGSIPTKEEILTNINEHFKNATPREQQALVDAAIAERKARAEAEAEQRGGDQAGEQAADAIQRSAEPQQPVTSISEELTPRRAGSRGPVLRYLKTTGKRVTETSPPISVKSSLTALTKLRKLTHPMRTDTTLAHTLNLTASVSVTSPRLPSILTDIRPPS